MLFFGCLFFVGKALSVWTKQFHRSRLFTLTQPTEACAGLRSDTPLLCPALNCSVSMSLQKLVRHPLLSKLCSLAFVFHVERRRGTWISGTGGPMRTCVWCNGPLPEPPHRRHRRREFCSDICKQKHYLWHKKMKHDADMLAEPQNFKIYNSEASEVGCCGTVVFECGDG